MFSVSLPRHLWRRTGTPTRPQKLFQERIGFHDVMVFSLLTPNSKAIYKGNFQLNLIVLVSTVHKNNINSSTHSFVDQIQHRNETCKLKIIVGKKTFPLCRFLRLKILCLRLCKCFLSGFF